MRRIKLFVAEDNDADLYWLKTVLDHSGIQYDLSVVTDGEKAVDALLKRGPYAGAPDPDLIILDLNLPKIKGLEVLQSIPGAGNLPLCILTGSTDDREILKEKFGVRRIAYLVKPVDRERILNCFRCYSHLRPVAEELSAGPRARLQP